MIRVNKMKLQVVKLYPIFLDSVISTELHCDVSPKGSLDKGVFQFDLILCLGLVADSAMLKNPQFLTPFSSFSLQLRVIRCFGVGSSFLGSGTTLNNSKWKTWVIVHFRRWSSMVFFNNLKWSSTVKKWSSTAKSEVQHQKSEVQHQKKWSSTPVELDFFYSYLGF